MVACRRGIVTVSLEYATDEGCLTIVVADSRRVPRRPRSFARAAPGEDDLTVALRRLGGELRLERGEVSGFVQSLVLPVKPLDSFLVTCSDVGRLPKLVLPERSQQRLAATCQGVSANSHQTVWALIVEPSGVTRMNIGRILGLRGLAAAGFPSGEVVLRFMREHSVSLLVVDLEDAALRSPEWWQALERGRFRGPIIGLTAHADDVPGALKERIAQIVRKPIEREALDGALDRVGAAPQSRREMRRPGSTSGTGTSANDGELNHLIREYAARLPDLVHGIDRAISQGELAAARAELHRLKAAALFGYPEVSNLARSLERDLLQARSAEFEAHLRALTRIVEDLVRATDLPRLPPTQMGDAG